MTAVARTPADGVVHPPTEVAARYHAEGLWDASLLPERVLRHADRTPDAIALVSGRERMSYGELAAVVERLAGRLASAGLRRHDRAMLQLPNGVEAVTTMLAMMRIGVRPVLVLPSLREREIRYVAEQCAPRAFVVAAQTAQAYGLRVARRLRSESEELAYLFVLGRASLSGSEIDLRAEHRSGPFPSPPVSSGDSAEDVALYLLSAGTTGLPKPIPRTHRGYVCNIRVSSEVCAVDESTVYLAALPVLHNFALGCPGVFGVLAAGGRVVLAGPDPVAALDLVERERVTLTASVPALALQLAAAARARRHDLSALRGIQVGGARLPAHHADEIRMALECAVQQVYGMGEGLLNFTRWDDPWEVVRQTQGRPASPADEWRIVDAAGADVPPGHSGELLARGPYTIRGYLAPDEVNVNAFTADGYYRTGDIVRVHPSGNFVVEGRHRDFVNVGGEKVSAQELEELLVAHPAVDQCAVVSMPDRQLGEAICLYVVATPGTELSIVDIRGFLDRAGVARFKFPARLEVRSELPTTALGKLDRAALREHVARSVDDAG